MVFITVRYNYGIEETHNCKRTVPVQYRTIPFVHCTYHTYVTLFYVRIHISNLEYDTVPAIQQSTHLSQDKMYGNFLVGEKKRTTTR